VDPGARNVDVGGRVISLTHLNRVMFPGTGTTKAEVIAYYASVAPALLPLLRDRPVVRRRFPDGTDADGFYERNAPAYLPQWFRVLELPQGSGTVRYPMVDDAACLVWMSGHSALELHTPQWRATGPARGEPDRLVIDLDPGEGAGLAECAVVAQWVREHLEGADLTCVPVTSGSKGMQVYAAWPGSAPASTIEVARALAFAGERALPGLVVARMTKASRPGRVLLDWSQNNPAKTTVSPYSLRGLDRPYVACPRWWGEIDDPRLAQVEMPEVADRLLDGDPLTDAGLGAQ
jgi:bifunctional non-homologous end joining protein LigD